MKDNTAIVIIVLATMLVLLIGANIDGNNKVKINEKVTLLRADSIKTHQLLLECNGVISRSNNINK